MKQNIFRVSVIVITLPLVIIAGLLWWQNSDLHKDVAVQKQRTAEARQAVTAAQNTERELWLQNGRERYGTNMQKIATTGMQDYAYLPELQIRIPYSPLASSIEYAMRVNSGIGGGLKPTESDVTSSQYVAPITPTRMDCSMLVRVEIANKANAYSPHEKTSSVKLNDGRRLQIYEFVNDSECQPSWDATVKPSYIADLFRQATAY